MADFITEMRDRRILPAVGVYVASSWVLIEILDRLVDRYLLSPYFTDIVFWGLYSLIPAVMMVAWTHGRPGKDKATRLEKVGVPINLIATIGLLITVFGDKDLDLTATKITVDNELGQQETHYIPSETFRRRMVVFFWDNESGDPELDWLQYGITELLVQDLQQDPFVLATSPWNNFGNGFYPHLEKAGFGDGLKPPKSLMRKIAQQANRQYFVEGSLNRVDGEYQLTARVWDSQTMAKIAEIVERNWDFYTAVDSLSNEIREQLEVPDSGRLMAEDIPLTDTYGESEKALKAYIHGLNARLFDNDFEASDKYFDAAISFDQNFVLAWLKKAYNMVESGNLPAAQESLSKAQALDYLLPSRNRIQLKMAIYRFAGEHEKHKKFLILQTQVRDDASSHNKLAMLYMHSEELEKAKAEYLIALERDALNVGIFLQLSTLERATGNFEAAIDYAHKYQQQKPEDIEANILLGDLLRDSGDLEGAKEQYLQAQILQNAPVTPTLKLSVISILKGDTHAARKYLAEAESYAQTPMEKVYVRQGVARLESRLGRIQAAIGQTREQEEYLLQSQGLLDVTISVYTPLIEYYILLGDLQAAEKALDTANGLLAPPLDKFLSFSEALIHAENHDIPAANLSLQRAQEIVDQFQLKFLMLQVNIVKARISMVEGDFQAMANHYQQAIDQMNRSVVLGDLSIDTPLLYSRVADAQTAMGDLDAAEQAIEAGSQMDPSQPLLWVSRARLQQARNMPHLALASVNYALAIWNDADEDYVTVKKARELARDLQSLIQ